MANLTHSDRCDRLDQFIAENRLLRKAWTKQNGKERACLLAALSPECGKAERADVCPADVMPQWLANLTPSMDDNGSAAAWPAMVRRYAAVARRWSVLTASDWTSLDYQCRAVAVRFAMSKTEDAKVLGVCENVCVLLDRAARLEPVAAAEWNAASASAAAAYAASASAAAAYAASAAYAAAYAASAAYAAYAYAASAAYAAAYAASAAYAAYAYAAAADAAAADAAAANADAWDTLTDRILTAIEAQCALREAA